MSDIVTPRYGTATADRAAADLTALVRHFEGLCLTAYPCPAGVPTVGYGHTAGVKLGQTITQAQAESFLQADLAKARRDVDRLVAVPLAPHQLAALTSFVFNLGVGAFQGSTLLKMINGGDADGAAGQFERWVYAKVNGKSKRLPGLVARRAAEEALYRGGQWRDALAAPMAQAVEEAPAMKPLAKSTTVQAGAGGLTLAGVTVGLQQAKEVSGAARELLDPLPAVNLSAGWIVSGILAAAIALMLYRRWDDRRKAVA